MSKIKKKKRFRIIKLLPIIVIIGIICGVCLCLYFTSPVSNESKKVVFSVDKNSNTRSIIKKLEKEGLIKNADFALLYYKINYSMNKDSSKNKTIKFGDFVLNKNMSLRKIFDKLVDSSGAMEETVIITFHEGKNMRGFIKAITDSTNITENEIYNTLSDKEYIKSLMNDYWFLTDDILDPNIYYPLEGYLAPDTYEFKKSASIKDIFKVLLDQEENILGKYKTNIDSSSLTIHEVITLASMAELEGKTLDDRKNIIGVFMNRLNSGMSLGSDVTTYYAAKVDMGDRDLYQAEIDSNNPYNTRSVSNVGKLPIGPICNPSKDAIDAVLNYTKNDYYYFVSDKNSKIHFTKTGEEHNQKINELKRDGLWFTY